MYFNHGLVEMTVHMGGLDLELYKVGGGTVGRAYEGTWDFCLRTSRGQVVYTETLATGTRKTHQQAAMIMVVMVVEGSELGDMSELDLSILAGFYDEIA